MRLVSMIVISLMAGCVVGGFVWYGWGLTQNIVAAARRSLERKRLAAMAVAEKKRAEIEEEVRREQEQHGQE